MKTWKTFAVALICAALYAMPAFAEQEAAAPAEAVATEGMAATEAAAVEAAPAAVEAAAAEAAPAVEAAAAEAAPAEEAAAGEGYGLPVGITDHKHEWDTLWHHVLIDLYVIGGIFAAITIWFMMAYRRQSDDQEGDMPAMSLGGSIGWALVPAVIFMADDFYLAANGWKLWNDQRTVPENATEIKTTAGKWYWEFEYENGTTLYDGNLFVEQGKPVVVRGTSGDVVHSLFVPEYRIKEDIMPGRVTYIWFYPENTGAYTLTCTEYCGVGHSNMFGKVVVVSPEELRSGFGDEFEGLTAKYLGDDA